MDFCTSRHPLAAGSTLTPPSAILASAMTNGDDVTEPAAKGEALPEVLTVEQAAALLQLSPKTVKRLAQRGGVPGRRVGNQWRFPRGALMDWVAGGDP